MIKCAIIDDEPLAREGIANHIGQIDFMELVGTGSNPVDLTRILSKHNIDLLFLDIEMPVINGIEFLKMAKTPYMVIITTAYPSYALEGFQLDVLDYLVKPITFSRFFKAATKSREYYELRAGILAKTASAEPGYFFIKCDYKYEKIHFSDILYVQAMQNYVIIQTLKGKFITLLYLKNIEEKLDNNAFIRVHKSYIVSVSKIESIENNDIAIGSFRIPISRNYQAEVLEKVVNNRLWKKDTSGKGVI
ncbi:LytTR family DNA-binding domain-containing protein [Dyadobacter sp. CY326]|uniref:LytR/AlgR family response regulator transcription factor n=1 Tax=Dyadobacter sp. CY326 TaxID=2907300 RepID=UPI001F186D35|nr:LytTR family DNA-binding domain-containing protein [Dyadobacter sp. CY326]MCE7064086.1 LytTR family DNA-binding domain-containing protein [Dyadobacter sp. CY326]